MVNAKVRRDAEHHAMLRGGAWDAAEGLRATATSQAIPASKRRVEFVPAAQRLARSVADFSNAALSFDATLVPDASPDAMRGLLELNVKSSELMDPTVEASMKTLDALVQSVKTLRAQKRFAAIAQGGQSPLPSFAEKALDALGKVRTILKDGSQSADAWAVIPQGAMSLMHEVVGFPPLDEVIEEYRERLNRMRFEAEQCSELQRQATADGDMKQVELLYFKRVAIQEGMVGIYTTIFGEVEAYYAQRVRSPMERLHEEHKGANAQLAAMMQANDDLKQRLAGDNRKLQVAASNMERDDSSARAQFDAFMATVAAQMEGNTKAVDSVFVAIETLEKSLVGLCAERADLIKRQLEAIDREGKRRREIVQFQRFISNHAARLNATQLQREAAEEVTDVVDEMVCAACNALEQHIRGVDEDVEAKRLSLHADRLEHFRGIYLTLGDLQHKKERNLEELDKKIAHVHIQQELAMETFNPKAKDLAQAKKDLMRVREEMEGQLSSISDKAQLQIEAFKPTERALIEAGRTFEHPVQELERMNRERQTKLLEYHKLMHSDDGESDKAPVDVEMELKAIEEARQAMHPRKPMANR